MLRVAEAPDAATLGGMNTKSYDFIVIGGGSAGYAAANSATAHGLRCAVVDGSEHLGGLCILRGCMPSKILIESANRFRTLLRADEFGLRTDNPRVVMKEIRARKEKLIEEFADYRRQQLEDGPFDLIRGNASFTSPQQLTVQPLDGSKPFPLEFKSALIATGSTPNAPNLPGLHETGFINSDDALLADHLPASIIVLGGGAIALELAHYYAGLGSETSIIQRSSRIARDFDPDISEVVTEAFRQRQIGVHTDTQIQQIGKTGDKNHVTFNHQGQSHTLHAEQLLCALGRKPNTAKLNLEAAGVHTTKLRIDTDPMQRTNQPHIFAAGDVCGPYEVVHLAITQGETAAHNAAVALGKAPARSARTMDYRNKLFAMFTDPEAATVGLTEKEAKEQKLDFATASHPFADHGKSMLMGETHGFVKLIAERQSGTLLGASVVGPHASELIHEITVAISFGASASQLATIPHYHPTLSEIWTYPAEELTEV